MRKTLRHFSDVIKISRLERETWRWLYLGLLIAVILHALTGIYLIRRSHDSERELLALYQLKKKPVPIKLIIKSSLGGGSRGFRIQRPNHGRRILTRLETGEDSPTVRNGTVKSPSILDELGFGGTPGYQSDTQKLDTVDRVPVVPGGLDYKKENIERVEKKHLSVTDELISIEDLDFGSHKGLVLVDPNDHRNIRGILHIPLTVEPFSSGNMRPLHDFVLPQYTGLKMVIDRSIHLSSRDIFDYPILYFATGDMFELMPHEKKMLKEYLLG